jgi:hypothetical protein
VPGEHLLVLFIHPLPHVQKYPGRVKALGTGCSTKAAEAALKGYLFIQGPFQDLPGDVPGIAVLLQK